MFDIILAVILMFTLAETMRRHGTWKPLSGLGDFVAWFMVSLFALALVRIPIYLVVCGPHFPFNPSSTLQFISGIIAIAFWWAMMYWRIPMRLVGRKG